MEKRTNRPAKLVEQLDGDFDGDILGGIIANHEIRKSKPKTLIQTQEEISTIPHSTTSKHSLEAIGADNFRGFPNSDMIFDTSQAETHNF